MAMKKMKGIMIIAFVIAIHLVAVKGGKRIFEGIKDMSNPTIKKLAEFAFEEHNKSSQTQLKFDRAQSGFTEEVDGGMMYYLVLQASDQKFYDADILVNPSQTVNKLISFKDH